ncbi:MAG TPA: class I SAM-dependent methyltransferase, partial [Phnomibacter sp.]|nr:class I SAM-dependent methyltransferase [Phnomibacter sp.]
LPDEHAAFLTRAAGPDNFGVFAEYIFSVAVNGDEVLHCFKNGGGIAYDKYHRFYHAMDEDMSMISTFNTHFLPDMPELTKQLEKGIAVLDAGCGTGGLVIDLAARFPNSRFTGVDLTGFAIEMAQKKAQEKGLTNTEFLIRDLTDLDRTANEGQYEFVMTMDAIHDQQKPKNVLRGLYRTLKDDGVYLMVDINGTGHVHSDSANMFAPLLYSLSCMHCVPVSLGQGGEGLGAMWGEEKIMEYIVDSGFSSVEVKTFPSDPLNNWFVIRK